MSLNLNPDFVKSYARHTDDLYVQLTNGRTLILEGFYENASTGEKNLFLSEDGNLYEVQLTTGQNNAVHAQYDVVDASGKWSSFDDLVFLDLELIEPIVAPLLAPVLGGLGGLGAAGAIGGAALSATTLLGGGGPGSNGSIGGPAAPTVIDADLARIIGGTGADTVVITGAAEPGYQVEVAVGDVTEIVIISDDGTWEITLDPTELPDDGIYPTIATVTDPEGTTIVLDGPTVDIDTTAPDVAINGGTQSVGDFVNAAGHATGTVITGTGEVGASISVEINGTTHSTTVSDTGTWSVTFTSSEIATGEYNEPVTITTTDARGNTATITDTLIVDTIAPVATIATVASDDVINLDEATGGITLTGNGESSAAIVGEFQGVSHATTVSADGTWSVAYDASVVTAGTYDSTISIVTTDAYGNSSTTSHTIHIDTENAVTLDATIAQDGTINAAEAAAGVTLTGTAEAGSQVIVALQGTAHTVTAAADGSWSANFTSAEISPGAYDADITVSSTDAAGNTATTSGTVHVDTVNAVTLDAPIAQDGTVNAAEAGAGVTLTGTAQAGASVVVTLAGVSHTVTAGASGGWSATFPASEITAGEYDAAIAVTSTDAAGNTATTSGTVRVDTQTSVALDAKQAGDNVINGAEAQAGVALPGTAQAGASVAVTLQGITHTVTADASGNWSSQFSVSEIPGGEYDASVTVVATDPAGNTDSTSGTVRVDTTTSVSIAPGQAGGTMSPTPPNPPQTSP